MSRPFSRPASPPDSTAAPGAPSLHSGHIGHGGHPHSPGEPSRHAPAGDPAPAWTPAAKAELTDAFGAALQRGLHGLCFSPYLEGQQPGDAISEGQIRERLQIMRPHARWIRSFSCTDGHQQTPRIAHEMGLKTLVGAWLGQDAEINEHELQGVIEVARAGYADIVAVGNEVLLREDLSEDELLASIQRVKDALSGLPNVLVGYVDAYYLFEKHPRITAACDVVMTNCYPFWEGCPREQALPYMQSMLARTRAAAPGKRVLISETGWPDQGSPFHGAQPSREGAMQYFVDCCRWADDEGIELFYFSAFDEAWKVGAEGDVGAFWGLWDKHGSPKFT